MKTSLLLITITLFLSYNNFAQDFIVKSLNIYTTDNEIAVPVVTGGNKLVIEFDVQAEFLPNMNVVFRFCDKGWAPTSNIFLLKKNGK